jgi:carbon monoxide dehydrogenase subunit G
MELEHSFTVPVPVDRAWDVLLDVERVAPCMPGASLDSVHGDEIKGRIKVKVGPISMVYAGTALFTERDAAAGVMKLEASGKETRGAGTASAIVRSELHGEGEQTHVIVHTTLNVTGRPAQFGRGVMAEVGGKLIGIFAANLADMLTADNAAEELAQAGQAGTAGQALQPEADLASQSVEELHLALRSYNSLRREGIHTVGELASRTERQLLAIDNIGPASVEEIRQKLAERGLSLGDAAGTAAANGTIAAAAASGTAGTGGTAAGRAAASGTAAGGPAAAGTAASGGDAGGTPAGSAAARAGGPTGDKAAANGDYATARPARPAYTQPDDDAIDLLSVAGLPVLKRAIPVVAGLVVVAAAVAGFRFRRRRAAR